MDYLSEFDSLRPQIDQALSIIRSISTADVHLETKRMALSAVLISTVKISDGLRPEDTVKSLLDSLTKRGGKQ